MRFKRENERERKREREKECVCCMGDGMGEDYRRGIYTEK